MKKIIISVLQISNPENRAKVLELLEHYKKDILATGHFDDVKISLSTENDHYLSLALYPKSTEDWRQYRDTELPVHRNWYHQNLEVSKLTYNVHSWITEVPSNGLEIYKKEVKAYQEWFKELTKDFTVEQLNNAWGILDTPDLKKGIRWTAKLEGMTEILGLTEDEIKKIDEEFLVTA